MRIAIVNDMVLAAEALRRVVAASPHHEVAWIAHDGQEAVQRCRGDRPDLILMDVIMPRMDGVQATREIMTTTPCPILIVTASVESQASKVYEALGAGAVDAVNTPLLGPAGAAAGRDALLAKIDTIQKLVDATGFGARRVRSPGSTVSGGRRRLVAIGASCGGPTALATLLGQLPARFPTPVLVVQHVGAEFLPGLVEWLDRQTPLAVSMARGGTAPRNGQVLVAGPDSHLVVTPAGTLAYTPEPSKVLHRPSVNVLFDSIADLWSLPCVGVLLTGMGNDGAQGLLAMRKAGHHTIAQDQSTSAIFGMPRAAIELGAAAEVLPLESIASALVAALNKPHRGAC